MLDQHSAFLRAQSVETPAWRCREGLLLLASPLCCSTTNLRTKRTEREDHSGESPKQPALPGLSAVFIAIAPATTLVQAQGTAVLEHPI